MGCGPSEQKPKWDVKTRQWEYCYFHHQWMPDVTTSSTHPIAPKHGIELTLLCPLPGWILHGSISLNHLLQNLHFWGLLGQVYVTWLCLSCLRAVGGKKRPNLFSVCHGSAYLVRRKGNQILRNPKLPRSALGGCSWGYWEEWGHGKLV